jgi:hypothetical protein
MSITTLGVVKNGVIVPNVPLPEGAWVELQIVTDAVPLVSPELQAEFGAWDRASAVAPQRVERLTPAEIRRLPREQRQQLLAAAAEAAEQDYRTDKELTGFDAFSEEELDDDHCESP